MQTRKKSAQEAFMNMFLGVVISQVVLYAYGMPIGDASVITVIMIVLSFIRSYAVRRFFDGLGYDRKKEKN